MNLTITKRIFFTLFAVLFSVNLWGQEGLTGAGTSANPWQIGSAADWSEFATNSDYWDGYVKLTNNISVSEMVYGDGYTPFSGTFDGDGKTITFSYTGTDEDYGIALFYILDGATIHDLTVEGKIDALYGFNGGLLCYNKAFTTIENVTVGVDINVSGDDNTGYCGGFAATSKNLNFINCVYNGKIEAGDYSGGFCGHIYDDEGVYFTNCIFDPKTGSHIDGDEENGENFVKNGIIGEGCYYVTSIDGSTQGKLAYKSDATVPAGQIVKPVNVNTTNVKGVVTVVIPYDSYGWTGETLSITPEVFFDGEDATGNFTYSFDPSTVQAVGDYTLTITATDGGFSGTYNKTISVVRFANGDGSSEHPYEIASVDDWNCFAAYVNANGESLSGKYLKLTDNITVSTMVGTPEHPFSGNFSGATGVNNGIYTLTFNYGTSGSPTEEEIVAPFRYTDGATITYLKVNGDIYTNVGKEAGLIGVNAKTSANTQVTRVIVEVGLHCGEDLWDAEGGGFAYIGNGITFNSCAYRGYISANNYMGGFCGNADAYTTVFTYCLFNPNENGVYWAENFVYNMTGLIEDEDEYYGSCYFTLGHNQEESEQGILVYVGSVPDEAIGKKLTELYGVVIYTPILVTISNVNDIYIYDENVTYTITPTVKFNGTTVTNNTEYTYTISPTTVHAIGSYTLTITGNTVDESNIYVGRVTKSFEVVNGSSPGWAELQALLSGDDSEIKLTKDYTAGAKDAALSIPASRTVTIYLNGHTIDRHLSDASYTAGGQVLRISANANVTTFA